MLRHSAIFDSMFALHKDFSHCLLLSTKYIKIARIWVMYQWSAGGGRLVVISHNGLYILIFILQFLLLYTHSRDCGDVTR